MAATGNSWLCFCTAVAVLAATLCLLFDCLGRLDSKHCLIIFSWSSLLIVYPLVHLWCWIENSNSNSNKAYTPNDQNPSVHLGLSNVKLIKCFSFFVKKKRMLDNIRLCTVNAALLQYITIYCIYISKNKKKLIAESKGCKKYVEVKPFM